MNQKSRYNLYSEWLKATYGKKVYKLPVNIPVTCPNRDGTVGKGGCIYCGAKGGGNETLSEELTVKEQIEKNQAYIAKRYKAELFIPYFQSFTNTYLPFSTFEKALEEAALSDKIVGIAISTRPDCIFEEQLAFLKDFQERKGIDISIELGLQTANDETLVKLNRGHDLADYVNAAGRIKAHGLQLCTHVILDLPWDSRTDVVRTAKMLSAVGSDFVKCHALYVEKQTELGKMYESGAVTLLSLEEYIERCILFLENISPEMVVQRIIGRSPESDSIITNWNTSWWKIKDQLEAAMVEREIYQGQKYHKNYEIIRAKCV